MKKLSIFLMLLLPAIGFAQTITVSGAGTAYYGNVGLNGTYSFAGTVNGKNSYEKSEGFGANGCSSCYGTQIIKWDGAAWIVAASGSGQCYYCNFSTTTYKINSTVTTLNPPCSGWPDGMNISGACEGGAIRDYALSANNVCQTGSLTLSWVNAITLGAGNIFTAILSDKYGSFSSGTVLLGTSASATATSMSVTIPGDREPGGGYIIKLTASEAPAAPVSISSPNITIGFPNDRPSVYLGEIEACEGQGVSMSTSSTYDSYQWYKVVSNVYTIVPGATTKIYSIPSVLEADQGNYSVQGKSVGGCTTIYSYQIPLNVSNTPVIDYLYPSNVNTCVGNTDKSFAISMDYSVSGSFTYNWKRGDNIVKTETTNLNSSVFSPSGGWQVGDAGQYTVVVSKAGCTNSVTSQIAIARIDAPITTPPSLTPSSAQVAPVTLTASGSDPSYQLLKWNGSTYVAVDYSSNSFYVSQAGKYVVVASNNCGLSGYSNEVTVTSICETPPIITPAVPTSLPATLTASTGFDDYVWYKWNGTSYQSAGTGSSLNATTAGQYAVKGYSYNCGYTDFSTPVTLADPCANDTQVPAIFLAPAQVTQTCSEPATWAIGAMDNCTASEAITYKYYITGGSAIGDANNLQTGTGSGTVFAADAVVHVFAFDAAGNKSTEASFNVMVNTVPTAPSAAGVAIASGELANLTAANCSVFKWYDQQTGGNLLHTGQEYTTAPLSANTTFYVACSNGSSCESGRTAVPVTVSCATSVSILPTLSNSGPINSGQTVNLTASNLSPSGQAAIFAGLSGQYVEVAQSAPNDNFTIEMWIKTTATNGGLFSAGSLSINDYYSDRHIYLENGMAHARIIPEGVPGFSSGKIVNDGLWHHIALTHKTSGGEGSKLYVDGLYTGSYPSSTSCVTVPVFRIGVEQHSGSNTYFTGSIDQVRVWSVVRTPAEIRSSAQLEIPVSTTGLVFNSNLNGSADATSGTNGSLVNGPTFANVDHYNYTWTGKNAPTSGTSPTVTTTGAAGSSYSLNVTPALCGTVIGGSSAVVINCVQLATLQSGNWTNPEIWSCDRMPSAMDNAKIEAGHTVNLTAGSHNVDQLTNNGTLTGTGSVAGSLYNNGTVSPGNSPGTINVLDFTGTGTSVINAEIAGASTYDKLIITGSASLGGTLNVVFIDGFVPQVGDAFDVLAYGSHTGTFASLNLPALPGTLIWKTDYNTSELRLSVIVNPLPVTLVSFNASVTDGQKVKLNWATTEEVNASHFVVERSSDAKNFGYIAQVKASGTTRLRNDYSAIDETPLLGISYYRLRQVDLDGKEYVYRTIAIELEEMPGHFVFPNPTKRNEIQMTFGGKLPKIELHDVNGRKVKISWAQTGPSVTTIKPASPLEPGIYILTTELDGVKASHKVVVIE